MRRFLTIGLLLLAAAISAVPAIAQSADDDSYSIMRPEPWLPPKYKSPRGTPERPMKAPRIHVPQHQVTAPPPPLYVPQTGQVLPNMPTINGAGPGGMETSQDRAVRCANQAGVYGANAGNPGGYVNNCIAQ